MWVEKLQLLRLPIHTHNSRKLVGMKKARGKRNQALFRDLGRGGIEKRNVYFFDLFFRTNLQNYLLGTIISVAATLPHHKKHAQP
jgi:hypothetical protein